MTGCSFEIMWHWLAGRQHWRRFAADREGAAAMLVSLGAPVIFGFTALAVDVGMWRVEQVRLQAAVDAATVAGAYAKLGGADATGTRSVVARELARNGFDPADGTTFTMTLVAREDTSAYEDVHVEATTDGALYFAKLLMSDPPDIGAQATGGADAGSLGRICVLGLDTSAPDSVQFRGTPDLDLNCTIASNSDDPAASIEINGDVTLRAKALIAAGGITGYEADGITVDTIWQNAPPIPDPFGPEGRNLQVPAPDICDEKKLLHVKKDTALTPGRYCGGIKVTSGAEVTFAPGLYVIDGGDLQTSGKAELVGHDVTFVFTGSSPSQIGGMDISGGTAIDLSAPDETVGWAVARDYQGVLFFQDPSAAQSAAGHVDNKLLGGSIARLDGAIYFPRESLLYSGGADLDGSCLMLVARHVMFRGNASYAHTDDACDGFGLESVRPPRVRLLG